MVGRILELQRHCLMSLYDRLFLFLLKELKIGTTEACFLPYTYASEMLPGLHTQLGTFLR